MAYYIGAVNNRLLIDGKGAIGVVLSQQREDSSVITLANRYYIFGLDSILVYNAVVGVDLTNEVIATVNNISELFPILNVFCEMPLENVKKILDNKTLKFRLLFDFNSATLSFQDFGSIIGVLGRYSPKSYIVSTVEFSKDMDDFLNILEDYEFSVYYKDRKIF